MITMSILLAIMVVVAGLRYTGHDTAASIISAVMCFVVAIVWTNRWLNEPPHK